MDGEIKSFIKLWVIAILCLCYCYCIVSRVPKGFLRLLYLIPVFYLFIALPLTLSSFHLGAPSVFFLVWLGIFKLLLFSLDQGPLSPPPPNLFHFILAASLPIKIKQYLPPNSHTNEEKGSNTKNNTYSSHQNSQNPQKSVVPEFHNASKVFKSVLFGMKVLLLGMIICAYDYREKLHPYFILALYCCHMYLALEILLALVVAPTRFFFGFEIEAQFNEPYLSSSLQDFWGRRWNLMVTNILRPTVYDPVRNFATPIIGQRRASLLAIQAAFTVSGLMHEVIYYYFIRVPPTWEVTWFFVLQGVSTAIEVMMKKTLLPRGWRLHRAVSGPLTLAFVAVTGVWLFFPQILRNGADRKAIREYAIVVDFVKSHFISPMNIQKAL